MNKKTGLRKSLFWILCLGLWLFNLNSALAQSKISISVTITNSTTNGVVFTLNGDTRTGTNVIFNSAKQWLTNSDITGCGSKTNLLNQLYSAPFSQVLATDTGSNSFTLIANANLAVTFSMSPGLGAVSYATQTVASVIALQGPVSALPTAQARTNVASYTVAAANAVENTNQFSQNSTATAQLMGLTNGQTVSGVKVFTNALGQWFGIISNSPAISGTVIALAGGLYTSPVMASPTMTNGVNWGATGFSSQNTNAQNGEQFGQGSTAAGSSSTAVGPFANAPGDISVAMGSSAQSTATSSAAIGAGTSASGENATALGTSASATALNSTAIGTVSSATATNSTAIGFQATAAHTNSTAVGANATTTAPNQVMLGATGISTVVQNDLKVQGNLNVSGNVSLTGPQTNGTFMGTNNFVANSDIAFVRKSISSLANGHNSGIVVGTNVFCELSGASAGFDTAGFANGRDGKMIILLNQNGFAWTNLNESGLEAVPANRIRTLTGADLILTNAAVTMIYNANVSRWIVVSHNP